MGTDKREIRRAILRLRDGLDREERRRASLLLTERILGHQWFYRSEYILGFVSFGSEIDTWEILKEALRLGKKVYVPKVRREEEASLMCFYRIRGLEELEEGYKGILEPREETEEYVCTEETVGCTLMLMPGVAFDKHRNRIGYGKGFYDKFLADKPGLQLRTIAVGFRCQVVEELPMSDTDVRPYQVICM